MGVTESRVRQLVRRGFLPAGKHEGRWYFRRHQVAVIANARVAEAGVNDIERWVALIVLAVLLAVGCSLLASWWRDWFRR